MIDPTCVAARAGHGDVSGAGLSSAMVRRLAVRGLAPGASGSRAFGSFGVFRLCSWYRGRGLVLLRPRLPGDGTRGAVETHHTTGRRAGREGGVKKGRGAGHDMGRSARMAMMAWSLVLPSACGFFRHRQWFPRRTASRDFKGWLESARTSNPKPSCPPGGGNAGRKRFATSGRRHPLRGRQYVGPPVGGSRRAR